jgi:hypothetical protein
MEDLCDAGEILAWSDNTAFSFGLLEVMHRDTA